MRATLAKVLPHAQQCLKYGMPAVAVDGKGVAGYAAFADHCSYFPMSGEVLDVAGDAVAGYTISKGGLQFPVGGRLPVGLVRRLVRLRLDEIADVRNGRRTRYYDDGRVKASGQMKDGQLHGGWKWYRKDGSLSRVGRFSQGEQVGTWETSGPRRRPGELGPALSRPVVPSSMRDLRDGGARSARTSGSDDVQDLAVVLEVQLLGLAEEVAVHLVGHRPGRRTGDACDRRGSARSRAWSPSWRLAAPCGSRAHRSSPG